MRSYLDTNVLVRYIVRDNEKQVKIADQWFHEAEKKKRTIIVTPLVIAETIFVLSTFYHLPRQNITEIFLTLLSQDWLSFPEREILLGAITMYGTTTLHIVDCYLITTTQYEHATLLSFDEKLLRGAGNVRRV